MSKINLFSNIAIQFFPGVAIEEIELEFSALQATDISGALRERVDHSWVEINKIQDSVGTFLFAKLSKVMLGILTIPHSNASCERIFSCVKKTKQIKEPPYPLTHWM